MTRIEWLTHEHFAPLVGQVFAVALGADDVLTMELVEATASSEPGGTGPEGQERTVWWCPSCQPAPIDGASARR